MTTDDHSISSPAMLLLNLWTPEDRQMKDVTILDRFNNAAVVKVVASDWIDYLQEAKVDGECKIINVLWELKPKPAANN